jgi:hypothetical protein
LSAIAKPPIPNRKLSCSRIQSPFPHFYQNLTGEVNHFPVALPDGSGQICLHIANADQDKVTSAATSALGQKENHGACSLFETVGEFSGGKPVEGIPQ